MFGNHALEVRVKKNKTQLENEPEKPSVTPEEITRSAKKIITYLAIGVMGSFAAAAILNTASEITVHKMTTEPEPKEKD